MSSRVGIYASQSSVAAFAFGNALEFDGVDDYVDFTGVTWGQTSTISLWFNVTSFSGMLFGDGSGGDKYIIFGSATSITLKGSGNTIPFTIPTMSINTWYHCVIIRSAGVPSMYINGVAATTGAQVFTADDSLSTLGARGTGASNFITGILDEVGILNGTAATPTQITDLYNGGLGANFTTVMGSNDLNYHLDEVGTDLTAVDSGGAANDGTLTNFSGAMHVLHDKPAFSFDNALEFDGVDDYVTMTTRISPLGAFTLSVWFKKPNTTKKWLLGDDVDTVSYIELHNTTTVIRIRNATAGLKTYAVPAYTSDTWYNLAITRDGSDNTKLFLNGVESTTGSQTMTGDFNFMLLGKSAILGGSYFEGTIDEYGIVDGIAANQKNIDDLYNGGLGARFVDVMGANTTVDLNYSLNESGSDSTAVDSGGLGNDGTLTGFTLPGAWVSYFSFDNALEFSAAQRINLTSTITLVGDYTISAWVKRKSITQEFFFSGVVNDEYALFLNSNTDMRVRTSGSEAVSIFSLPETLDVGNWYNIVVTRSGTAVRFYLNGVESSTGSSTPVLADMNVVRIGQRQNASGDSNSIMDEIGISSTAATATQIAALYSGGDGFSFTQAMGSSELNYSLNESGAASTTVDSSGNGNDGTLISFTLPGAWVAH